ncbi:MAG: hypothetical protein JO112_16825 [Planctomycetes bacterium]|nr:hypothetical protein [Planctomycetota bacterium]
MNDLESQEVTAQELVAFGKERGVDLSSTCYDFAFFSEGRYMLLWRKEGKVHYTLQGRINKLPESFKASASAFHGMWHEGGSLADIEQALDLLKDWLLDKKEVDDLPPRSIRSQGIG